MKRKLFIGLFLCFTQMASAQLRQIEGVVLDGRDISLLPGVEVCCGAQADTAVTDAGGRFFLKVPASAVSLQLHIPGYGVLEKSVPPDQGFTTLFLYPDKDVPPKAPEAPGHYSGAVPLQVASGLPVSVKVHQDETYEQVRENPFRTSSLYPFSAFTLNANDASFCNVRRFIAGKQMPPKEAVRIEEMVNHLPYAYPVDSAPGAPPLAMSPVLTTCPWHPGHWLLRLAVQAAGKPADTLIPNNIVLLVDISGSMEAPNKLPLLKKAFRTLVEQMDSVDRISVVVYAGSVSVALPPTPGSEQKKILDVIANLSANGSTAGQAGIELAFKLARENFIPGGNNRVILATDGDFNVGQSSDEDMRELISRYHDWGIYLTCIGVGMGNYKDSKLQTLAQWGQGNFVYLDNDQEASRVFGAGEYRKILVAFLREARVKVVFNPEVVSSYRLIGYESRMNGPRDSLASRLPGGEIGYGQSLTVFYEITPNLLYGGDHAHRALAMAALQYQTVSDGRSHQQVQQIFPRLVPFAETGEALRFASAVTLFGMLLQHSEYLGDGNYTMVTKIVRDLKGREHKDERKSFVKLVDRASDLQKNLAPVN